MDQSSVPQTAPQYNTLEDMMIHTPIIPQDPNSNNGYTFAPPSEGFLTDTGKDIVSTGKAALYGAMHNPWAINASMLESEAVQKGLETASKAAGYLGLPNDSLEGALIDHHWDDYAKPLLRQLGLADNPIQGGFDPISSNLGTPYQQDPEFFVNTNNMGELDERRKLFDVLHANATDAQNHPIATFAGNIAGDPTNWIGLGAGAAAGKLAGSITGAVVGAGYFGTQAASETYLMKDYNSDYQQSDVYKNGVTGAILGAILGGASGYLSAKASMEIIGGVPKVSKALPFDIPTNENPLDFTDVTSTLQKNPMSPIPGRSVGGFTPELQDSINESLDRQTLANPYKLNDEALVAPTDVPGNIKVGNHIPGEGLSDLEVAMGGKRGVTPAGDIAPGILPGASDFKANPGTQTMHPLDAAYADIKSIVSGDASRLDSIKFYADRDGNVYYNPTEIGC